MASKARLPRKRFFKLKGNQVELAVGLLLVSILEAKSADATVVRDGLTGNAAPAPDVPTPPPSLEKMLGVAPDAVKTISIEELKAHLTSSVLASLGLDDKILDLLDHDRAAAIRELEEAYRKKLTMLAGDGGHLAAVDGDATAQADDAQSGGDSAQVNGDDSGDQDAGFLGISHDFLPLFILAGVASVAAAGVAATSGGGHGTSAAENKAPVATSDAFTTNEDTPTTFDVRTNDTDVDGDALTVTQIDGTAIDATHPVAVAGGVISLGADGKLTFTPAANYNGTPSFTYTVSDGHGGTSTATVNLTVNPVNDAPVATSDAFTTNEDTPTTFDVRTNDTDADGDALTVTQIDGTAIDATHPVAVAGGVISLGADGKLTFTPAANYNGTPSFTYTVSDGHGGTSTATVNLTVNPVNDAPVATSDAFTTNEDTPTTFDVRTNDTDADGDALTVTQIDGTAIDATHPVAVAGGVISLGADGKLTFTPAANYNGTPSFTYTVSDGHGGTSTATVNLTVNPVNDAPVATSDAFTTNEDTPTTFDVRTNDTDADGDALTVTQIDGTAIDATHPVAVAGGVISLGADGKLTFTPAANYNGTPSFTYTVSDGHGGTSTATVNLTVNPVNDAPVATSDAFTTNEDTPTTFDVRTNDTDADGDALTVTQIDGTAIDATHPVAVAGGVISLGADGKLTFTPAANYNGTPSFTYTVSDGHGGTSTATVNLTVNPVNDAPVATSDAFTTNEDTPTTFDVRTNDTDVDGDALTVTQIDGTAIDATHPVAVAGGVISLGADGKLTFTPAANYNGTPSFTYTVSDGHGGTSTATVNLTVNPVNDAPVATSDAFTTNEDTPTTFDVRTNDTDVDGDALTVTQIDGTAIDATHPVAVAGGVISLGADGKLTFTPAANYNGTPSFTYTVSDGHGGTSTATVNLTVNPVNDAPVATSDAFTTNEDTPTTFDVRTNDTDADGDALTVTQIDGTAIDATHPVAVAGGVISLGADGKLTFTPAANYNGTPSFTYTVSDGHGGTSTATVNLTVNPVNDAPVATSDAFTTNEDTPTTFDVRTNDTDVDGDALTVTQIDGTAIDATHPVAVAGGVISLGADGKLTFTPAANYNGTPSFTYTVSDGHGGTSTATVNLTVNPVNDAPVATSDAFTTNEDTPTTFDVRTNDTDVDGDALTVTQIDGTAIDATHPVAVAGGVISLGADGKLTFTPAANYNGTPSFTYTVSDGHGGTATGTVNLNVTAVNDAPVNTVPGSLSANAGSVLAVSGLEISDVDGGSGYTTTLKVGSGILSIIGTVTGGAAVVGIGSDTLVLTGTIDQINATLKAIGYTSDAGFVGSTTLTVTTSDGTLTDTDTSTLTVSTVVSGVVADGYIAGAKVFIDANGNGKFDAGEPTATTDANGRFAFTSDKPGNILVIGGTNTDTNLPNTLVLSAPMGSTVISPLTTLIVGLMTSGLSLAQANAALASSLGLSHSVDFTHFDFLAPSDDADFSLAVQKLAVEVSTIMILAGAAAGANAGSAEASVLANIVAAINGGGHVDLTDLTTIHNLLAGSGLTDSQINSITAQASAINTSIDAAASSDDIAHTVVETSPGHSAPTVDGVLPVTQATLGDVVAHIGDYTALGITTLDAIDNNISLTDAQADALVHAGIHFVDSDIVTVGNEGTHLSTSLKGLESLHVDTVMITGAALTIEAGSGLDGISAAGLPQFVHPAGTTVSVTLDVTAGTVSPSLDLTDLAKTLHSDGIDHIGVTGGELILSDDQAHQLVAGGLDIVASADVGLTATADEVHALALDPTFLAKASVDHIDVTGDNITLSDSEAHALVTAGVDFVPEDNVQVNAEGTHLSTSLKGLESLHVDTVMITGAALTIEAGSGLDGVSAAGLPQFVHPAGTSVTLDVTAGTVNSSLDFTDLAKSLHNGGIDHIGVTGGELVLTDDQAHQLVAGGLDILPAADVGLTASVDEVHALALDPTFLDKASVDHIDVTGDNITLSDSEAHALVAAGVDFVPADDVRVNADGTHLSTSLKGLADLHVDTVMITGASHAVIIDAGASLAALSTETLPHFAASGGINPDVTLNIAGGTIDATTDVASIAHTLSGLGVDHIGVSGTDGLTLTADQAMAFHDAGLNFASAADITLDLTADQLASLVISDPTAAHDFGVDHLNVAGAVSLSDHDASALVAAGIDFVASDDVHVHAAGTHMSSSLSDLQALHVDSISVDAGITDLHISGGDLSLVTAASLPQFDVDQSDTSLNVTLHVDRTQLWDLDRLGTSLRDAGIDHFGVDQPLDTYDAATQAYMTQITHDTGISFVYDPQPGNPIAYSGFGQDAVHALGVDASSTGLDDGLVQSIVTAFQELEDHGHGGQVIVQDDVIPALAESGALRAYTADTLVVDGQHSGDLLLTTLQDIAQLGVDHVVVSDTGGPAYVDIGSLSGFSGDELTQVKSLFTELSSNVTGTKIFEGSSKVALVVDESVAHALSQVDGSMEKLASLGFTEVDVLMNAGSTTPPITSTAVEVKLIGQDDDLYKHLHHD
ncbi:Ig-like domain-containing protein [Sphingomonas sp. MMS24-J13]|uniref:Ig-like domain-containing protein n=1 Tax=Sphingomonas sp. MMS24-J13 TaxID=3238686 RepID=UPI00384F5CC6